MQYVYVETFVMSLVVCVSYVKDNSQALLIALVFLAHYFPVMLNDMLMENARSRMQCSNKMQFTRSYRMTIVIGLLEEFT